MFCSRYFRQDKHLIRPDNHSGRPFSHLSDNHCLLFNNFDTLNMKKERCLFISYKRTVKTINKSNFHGAKQNNDTGSEQ